MTTPSPLTQKRRRLGDLLLEADLITQDKLAIALTEQKKTDEQLGRIIVKLGFVPEQVMRDLLGSALGQASIDLDNTKLDPRVLAMVPKKLVERHQAIPVDWDDQSATLTLAMSDTQDVAVIDKIQANIHAGIVIKTVLAGQSEIARTIQKYYGTEISMEGILRELETGTIDLETLSTDQGGQFSHPMVRLVDMLLTDAVHREASDIHIEPEMGFVRIRYRMDGVLSDVRNLHRDYLSGLVVRIKVLSGMNIAETRAPQDGRFSLNIATRMIDFRVASQPTTFGENLVLRVLDRNKGIVRLEDLGLSNQTLITLKLMMARPEGIILVTGPTGSGKTTTLYSMLSFLNTEQVNIMTLEDPVEYPMQMVRQTTVNPAANLDFANGIRSMLRQDPDIILVGEIRDQDTAQMALRAAMTGHQVFSTLHTNSALGVFPRLLDIGVSAEILSGNIIGILSQRLIRRLCPACKKPKEPNHLERRLLGLGPDQSILIYTAVGCARCQNVGFKGRMTVMEAIRMDDDFDEVIEKGAAKTAILQLARKKGIPSIAEDGIRRVVNGSTSLEEITRVLDLSKRLEG
ncbi:MAG: Flp pilus assembly complex ATPase component TadA [Magnetococcales bacterium]|nr:Flp pilus assembly complex ATPase component TadA [Magnetococcales bacterium]